MSSALMNAFDGKHMDKNWLKIIEIFCLLINSKTKAQITCVVQISKFIIFRANFALVLALVHWAFRCSGFPQQKHGLPRITPLLGNLIRTPTSFFYPPLRLFPNIINRLTRNGEDREDREDLGRSNICR